MNKGIAITFSITIIYCLLESVSIQGFIGYLEKSLKEAFAFPKGTFEQQKDYIKNLAHVNHRIEIAATAMLIYMVLKYLVLFPFILSYARSGLLFGTIFAYTEVDFGWQTMRDMIFILNVGANIYYALKNIKLLELSI